MQQPSLFQKSLTKIWDIYSKDVGKSLIHLGAVGWLFGALAQVGALAFNKKRQRITVISLRDSLPSSKINNPSRCYGARIIVSIWQNSLIVFLNIKRQSSFLTVLLISVFSCRKIVRLQNPSRHISKHTITKAFLLKNGTLIKACHRASFSGNGHNGFFEKIVSQKSPSSPDEKQ